MMRVIKSLLPVLAMLGLAPLHAQTATENAKAEGKTFGRTQGMRAQDASTREPDAATVPNFGGIPGQSAYFDDPDGMTPDSGAQSRTHEGYQAMRASANQRARFAPVDLDATIKRAQEVSADPLTYTSGMTVTGAQGRCVPLPSGLASAGRYFATCNKGMAATQQQRSCPISLTVQITETRNYRYYSEVPFHTGIAPAISEFSGQLANGTCQNIGTADTCQVVREYGLQPSSPGCRVRTCHPQENGGLHPMLSISLQRCVTKACARGSPATLAVFRKVRIVLTAIPSRVSWTAWL
jgi:hypothetical protein